MAQELIYYFCSVATSINHKKQVIMHHYKFAELPETLMNGTNFISVTGKMAGWAEINYANPDSFVYQDGNAIKLQVPNQVAGTMVEGINNEGAVVATTAINFGHPGMSLMDATSFIYDDGTYISISKPDNAEGLFATGINDRGDVCGYYYSYDMNSPSRQIHGYVYESGTVKVLDVPATTGVTIAQAISDDGDVSGTYNGNKAFVYHHESEAFDTFAIPGATGLSVSDLNERGDVAGSYNDSLGSHGFIYADGALTTLDGPGAVDRLMIADLNNRGDVVGSYNDSNGTHGFLYDSGQYITIDVPDATGTTVEAIDDHGRIAGFYTDATGASHGFTATDTCGPEAAGWRRSIAHEARRCAGEDDLLPSPTGERTPRKEDGPGSHTCWGGTGRGGFASAEDGGVTASATASHGWDVCHGAVAVV